MSLAQKRGLASSLVSAALGHQPTVAVPTAFIHLLRDCTAAAFLAQCCHLSENSTDPEGWFERSHEMWRTDLNLSPEQIRRCVRDCTGMVEVVKKGLPARNFYRVVPEGITERLLALKVPRGEEAQTGKAVDVVAAPAQVVGRTATSGDQRPTRPVTSQTPPPVAQPTPQHSSVVQKKEGEGKRIPPERQKRDDVQPIPPVSAEVLTRMLGIWNANRGELPEAVGLSTSRKRALTVLLADCGGDVERTAELLTDAVKEVAGDEFWKQKKFGLDTLLPKTLGKAEAYRSRKAPKVPKQAITLPEFGVGQLVIYRRERYAIEAITDRHIDLWDEQNGSARILIHSDDIHSVRPIEVRA